MPPRRTASAAPAAPAVATAGRASRAHVIVACKLPFAWFEMQLCEARIITEHTQTGPREVTMYNRVGAVIRVRGTAYPAGTPPAGFIDRPTMLHGFSITEGIPGDFWAAWVEQHKRDPMVESGLIFAGENMSYVKGRAAEYERLQSGFEPIDVRSADGGKSIRDPRVGRPTTADVSLLETEDGARKRIEKAADAAVAA